MDGVSCRLLSRYLCFHFKSDFSKIGMGTADNYSSPFAYIPVDKIASIGFVDNKVNCFYHACLISAMVAKHILPLMDLRNAK